MTLFFISAALLVVLCLAFLLTGLFKNSTRSVDQEAVNITLARERRSTLDAALANGSIEQSSYDYERTQLEYDLAAELQSGEQNKTTKNGHLGAAIVVAVFIPIAAGALYLYLGNPAAITQDRHSAIASTGSTQPGAAGQVDQKAPALAEILPKLEERLAASPDDVEGWRLLGRSYLSINEFPKAQAAFAKAVALDENNVPTLAQLAESMAMINNGDLAGEPKALLERANKLDAANEHTLWLLSIARQQSGDHKAALAGFEQLASMSADNPEALATIEQMRSRSIEEIGLNNKKSETGATIEAPPMPTEDSQGAALVVNVDLTPEAKAAADASYAVFVYAKAADGPPMPLAVSRHTVSELPLSVKLDDSMAMIPNMTLSSFPQITVGARISASGNPIAQAGDWFIEISDVNVDSTEELSLTINQQAP